MARPDGPRGGTTPRPPMPGGGGIGLPVDVRGGPPGAAAGGRRRCGARPARRRVPRGGGCVGTGGRRLGGRGVAAGASASVRTRPGGGRGSAGGGATGRAAGAGAAAGRRRAPPRRAGGGGVGRSVPLEVTRRAGAFWRGGRGLGGGRGRLGGRGGASAPRGGGGVGGGAASAAGASGGGGRRRLRPWRPRGLLGGLLGLGRLLRLDVADEALALGLAADAVGLRVLDARGVRLDADAQDEGEVERLLVRHAELFGELVHTQLGCQVLGSVLHRGNQRPSILARTRR